MSKNKKYSEFPTWEEVESDLFSPEEIAASNLKVALMEELINSRKEKNITLKKLEEMTGVKEPVIAKMEKGSTAPSLGTMLKVLAALGKTLYIGDLYPTKSLRVSE